MKALGDYIHSLGLKFGIYSDAGNTTCAGRPGSLFYEKQDAESYASWGVDYLKYDFCGWAPSGWTSIERYIPMRDALNATGRPIVYSLCNGGIQDPWLWGPQVGNSWRTDLDIGDDYDSMLRVLDNNIHLAQFAGPGGWNDADMLQVGNGGMTYLMYRSHFALWCAIKAPLLIGCDVNNMTNQTYGIFTSTELIAVSQDPLGVQADLIYQLGPIQIWAGPLSDGSHVVILFNRHNQYDNVPTNVTLNFTAIGYTDETKATVRDLYAQQDVGIFTGSFTTTIQSTDVFAGRVIPITNN